MRDTMILDALRRLVLAGLATGCFGSVAAAAELWELEWTEVETEHFTIATPLPRDDAIRFAAELENFRTVAQLFLKVGAFRERVPTKIYVLPRLLPEFGLGERVGGYFRPGLRENQAVMAALGNSATATLKHEYVHFLVHNFNSQLYPTWLSEGLADLLSTLTVRDGVLEYGRSLPDRFESLDRGLSSWLQYESILEQRGVAALPVRDLYKFYAQSWLLTQYLAVGRGDATALPTQVEEYLSRVEAGAPDKAAFEEAFGIRVNQLGGTLLTYAKGQIPYYTAPLKQPLPALTMTARSMPRDRVAAELAMVLLYSGNPQAGMEYCGRAMELNPENALAVFCAASALLVAERLDEAEVLFRRAWELEPTNPARELDYGIYFLMRAIAEEDAQGTSEQLTAFLAEARGRFTHVHDMNPDSAEALFLTGMTYVVENDAAQAIGYLEAAHELVPGDVETQRNLAAAYIDGGQPERARSILRGLLAWSHQEGVEELQDMLDSIDSATSESDAD